MLALSAEIDLDWLLITPSKEGCACFAAAGVGCVTGWLCLLRCCWSRHTLGRLCSSSSSEGCLQPLNHRYWKFKEQSFHWDMMVAAKFKFFNEEELARGRDLTYQGTNWAVHRFFRLVEDVSGNRGTNKELHRLIAEVVAVVGEDIVGLWSVARANLQQEALKYLLGSMCDPEIFYSDRCPVWCSSRAILLDASTKVILSSINHHPCMPVTIDVKSHG